MKNNINKKLLKQFSVIVLVIVYFILFNISFYNLFTKNYINNYSDIVKEKSIDIEKYLPFEDDSLIVKEEASFKITNDIPKIDGATALYPVYSAFVNALYQKESLVYDKVTRNFLENSKIDKTGTTVAYKKLIDGGVDIVFCAKPSEKQLEYAKSKNVEMELVPIGKEAFVFIVNKNNIVDNLSIEQIKNIYSGKIKNWKEVLGENKPIISLVRKEGSGSQTAMESFMGETKVKKNFNVFYGRRIGYSFRYYIEGIINDSKIKMLKVNGIEPTKENIRDGKYPIVDNFYMIYRKDDNNKNIEAIKNFILSKQGQEIIDKTGYVSIVPYE